MNRCDQKSILAVAGFGNVQVDSIWWCYLLKPERLHVVYIRKTGPHEP